MSDEEAGGIWFWFEFWFLWLFPSFWFIVGVMMGTQWDIEIVVKFRCVVILIYLRKQLSCKRLVEFFVVS